MELSGFTHEDIEVAAYYVWHTKTHSCIRPCNNTPEANWFEAEALLLNAHVEHGGSQ
jgi:hypothetical protein